MLCVFAISQKFANCLESNGLCMSLGVAQTMPLLVCHGIVEINLMDRGIL